MKETVQLPSGNVLFLGGNNSVQYFVDVETHKYELICMFFFVLGIFRPSVLVDCFVIKETVC